MAIDDKTLDELAKLEREATPGPWMHDCDVYYEDGEISADFFNEGYALLGHISTGESLPLVDREGPWTDENEAAKNAAWKRAKASQGVVDARFIAAMRNALPELLASARELARVRSLLKRCDDWAGTVPDRYRSELLDTDVADYLNGVAVLDSEKELARVRAERDEGVRLLKRLRDEAFVDRELSRDVKALLARVAGLGGGA